MYQVEKCNLMVANYLQMLANMSSECMVYLYTCISMCYNQLTSEFFFSQVKFTNVEGTVKMQGVLVKFAAHVNRNM